MARTLLYLAAAIIATIIAGAPIRGESIHATPESRGHYDDIRWSLAEQNGLVFLKVPTGYLFNTSALKASLGKEYVETVNARARKTLLIETLWPEMGPKTPQNLHEFIGVGRKRKVTILVQSINDVAPHQWQKELERRFLTRRHLAERRGVSYTAGKRYGLVWLKAQVDPGVRVTALSAPDFYFQSDNDGTLKLFISCTREEVIDHEDDPSSHYSPGCTQYFYSEKLHAIIEADFRRKYLEEWKKINGSISGLLLSFIAN